MFAENFLPKDIIKCMSNMSENANIYLVGGAVRDYFMNEECSDLDFVMTTSSFNEMSKILKNNGFNIFLETPEYFTIRAQFPSEVKFKNKSLTVDFVLARKDGIYKDGRHPENVEVGTILDDLKRRDFTMNAIAIDVKNGEIIDPFGGYYDIKYNKLIKCVGNYTDRFNEDALRIIRAIRFFIKYNKNGFKLDSSISNILFSDGPMKRTSKLSEKEILILKKLKNISVERKKDELTKMFKYNTSLSIKILSFIDEDIQNYIYYGNEQENIWFMPTTKKK